MTVFSLISYRTLKFLLPSLWQMVTGAASYMPYTYAALPQTPTLPTATAGAFPGLSYQTATAQATSLQEARMQ